MITRIKKFIESVENVKAMKISNDVKAIHSVFKNAGYKLYVVGGAVRDIAMGKTTYKDLDLATNAMPDDVEKILTDAGYDCQLQGKAFGVVVVFTKENKAGYEIATFRQDGTGRKPEVTLGVSIEDDVQRRDLTINALFYDLDTNSVVDLVGGMDDIKNNTIRAVGNPKDRFSDDKLRILRAIRFASRFNYKIDDATWDVIKDMNMENISNSRIVGEITNASNGEAKPGLAWHLLIDSGMAAKCFNGLQIKDSVPGISSGVHLGLAKMLDGNTNLGQRLVNDYGWPIDVARSVDFLCNLKNFSTSSVLLYKNKLDQCDVTLEDMLDFGADSKIAKALWKFKKTVNGNDLLSAGFLGKQLGTEMARLEEINFKKLLSSIN